MMIDKSFAVERSPLVRAHLTHGCLDAERPAGGGGSKLQPHCWNAQPSPALQAKEGVPQNASGKGRPHLSRAYDARKQLTQLKQGQSIHSNARRAHQSPGASRNSIAGSHRRRPLRSGYTVSRSRGCTSDTLSSLSINGKTNNFAEAWRSAFERRIFVWSPWSSLDMHKVVDYGRY